MKPKIHGLTGKPGNNTGHFKDGARHVKLTIRVSDDDNARIEKAAGKAGLSVAAFIRNSVLKAVKA